MIERLRKEIDSVDRRIVSLIEKRMNLSRRIISLKRKRGIPIRDKKREKEIVGNLIERTKLDKGLIMKLYKVILSFSRKQK